MRLLQLYPTVVVAVVTLIHLTIQVHGLVWNNLFNMKKSLSSARLLPVLTIDPGQLPSWEDLQSKAHQTITGQRMHREKELRAEGRGSPHTNAKVRLFNSSSSGPPPTLTFYRDTAAWCPYCQKVWIFLEEKQIPYVVEKINMRSYGDKPKEFLQLVPNGLLPAIKLNGQVQTDSLQIMMTLEATYQGVHHRRMWPSESSAPEELKRAKKLMQLERELFSAWCGLVFRPSMGAGSRKYFEQCLDEVDRELTVSDGPWFLPYLSIIDLTYISHVERMCASVPYWAGFKVRGHGRWPNIERWMDAFEALPSYMATKSDYYTHVKDIPPQYGPGYAVPGSEGLSRSIDGEAGHWELPLPPFGATDVEPVSPSIDPGETAAREEAACCLLANYEAVVKFALRGAGSPGAKRFQVECGVVRTLEPSPLVHSHQSDVVDRSMDRCLHRLHWLTPMRSPTSGSSTT